MLRGQWDASHDGHANLCLCLAQIRVQRVKPADRVRFRVSREGRLRRTLVSKKELENAQELEFGNSLSKWPIYRTCVAQTWPKLRWNRRTGRRLSSRKRVHTASVCFVRYRALSQLHSQSTKSVQCPETCLQNMCEMHPYINVVFLYYIISTQL